MDALANQSGRQNSIGASQDNSLPPQLFEHGRIVVFKWSVKSGRRLDYVTPNVAKILGYTAEDFYEGRIHFQDIIHPDDLMAVSQKVENAFLRFPEVQTCELPDYRLIDKNGDIHWVQDNRTIIAGDDGLPEQCLGYIIDITQRKQAMAEAQAYQQMVQGLLQLPLIFYRLDEEGSFTTIAGNGLKAMGMTPSDLDKVKVSERFPDYQPHFNKALSGQVARFEAQGSYQGKSWAYTNLITPDTLRGEGAIGVALDITEHKALELELRHKNQILESQMAASQDGVIVTSLKGEILSTNDRFMHLFNIPNSYVEDNSLDRLIVNIAGQMQDSDFFRDRARYTAENPLLEEKGQELYMLDGRVLERYSHPLLDDNGEPWGRVCFYRDITQRKQLELHLADLAHHDPLTGLYNRRSFDDKAHEELERARRYDRSLTLLLLDIDHFKTVNDRFGHGVGDMVLSHFAEVCGEFLRENDISCRIGGEEFVILMPETDLEGAQTAAERLREIVEETAFEGGDDLTLNITVSIGIAALQEDDQEIAELLERADENLYAAKRAGRNQVHS